LLGAGGRPQQAAGAAQEHCQMEWEASDVTTSNMDRGAQLTGHLKLNPHTLDVSLHTTYTPALIEYTSPSCTYVCNCMYVGGARRHGAVAGADRGSRPAGAGRSGRVALKGASDWRGHAAPGWVGPEVLAGGNVNAGPSCGYSVQLGCDLRTGCCSGAATGTGAGG
jgi:hypothetical protein